MKENEARLSAYSPHIALEIKGCEKLKDILFQINQHMMAIEDLAHTAALERKYLEARLNDEKS